MPLQSVAKELQRTAEKGEHTAVLPAGPYRDRDLVDTGMTQIAPNVPPAQWAALPKVLVVGQLAEDAWAVAPAALAVHQGVQEMAAIVNAGHPGAEPTIKGLLNVTGWSREDLAIAGTHLSVTATSRTSQWEPLEPGPAVWPAGYRLLLRRCIREAPDDKAPQPLPKIKGGGASEVARMHCSLDKLEVENGAAERYEGGCHTMG